MVSAVPTNEGKSAFLVPVGLDQHLPWHGNHGLGNVWEGVERSTYLCRGYVETSARTEQEAMREQRDGKERKRRKLTNL